VRRHTLELERRFESLYRVQVVAPVRSSEAQPDQRSTCGDAIAGLARFCEDLLELCLGRIGIGVQPKLKLCIGETKLAIIDFSNVPTGFEVLDRHAELLGELP
jgi:hypothetical protein